MKVLHQPEVVFVHRELAQWPDLDAECRRLGIDGVLNLCGSGRDVWVLSTYLRLRRRGLPVRLSPDFIPGSLCVAHSDDVTAASDLWRCFCVATRADRDRTFISNLEIVQSPAGVTAPGSHYIPNWVQPGLTPRDEARGDRLERLGFFGPSKNLAARFREPAFLSALNDLGFELVLREKRTDWSDYSDIDAVIAVRDGTPTFLAGKPASKLVNAWHAGVPAFVGSEPAFHHHGCDGVDFHYVTEPQELLDHLRSLRDDPSAYRRLRYRAKERAQQLTNRHIEDAWLSFFEDVAFPAYAAWLKRQRYLGAAVPSARYAYGLLRRRLHGNQYTRGYDYWGHPVVRRQSRRRRFAHWIDALLTRWDARRVSRNSFATGAYRWSPRQSFVSGDGTEDD